MADTEFFEYPIDSIKRRVKKLLALSKSPNENEAVTALQKANELIAEFGLSIDEFSCYMSQKIKTTKRDSHWRNILSNAVGNLYATYHYKDKFGNFVFVGEELDVFMSSEMYRYLEKAVDRMAAQNIRRNARYHYRQSYRAGIAHRLYERMLVLGQQCSWRNPKALYEKQKKIEKFVRNQLDLTDHISKSAKRNPAAFVRGQIDADTISLNRQMSESLTRRIVYVGR